MIVCFDGDFFADEDISVGLENRSFKYGDGFFETVRVQKGVALFAKDHILRLQKTARLLGFEAFGIIDEFWIQWLAQQLYTANAIGECGRMRINFFRGGEGKYTPISNDFHYLAEIEQVDSLYYPNLNDGAFIDVFSDFEKPCHPLFAYKTNNALLYVLAGKFAREHRLDDAILLNERGKICETVSSNIFVYVDKVLLTPALSEGCVDGVMRKQIIRLCGAANIPVIEKEVNLEELQFADEVFTTNAIQGIQWVKAFRNRRYYNRMAHSLSALLQQEVAEQLKELQEK